MIKQMYKRWWKVLGALLVLYSILAGLAVPVGPGLSDLSPKEAKTGEEVLIQLRGYNTHFKAAASSLRIWLRHKDLYLPAAQVHSSSDWHALARFHIPANLPGAYRDQVYDVIVNDDEDGTFILPRAFSVLSGRVSDEEFRFPQVESVKNNDPQWFNFPHRIVLYESIRNLLFHVPMWFAMTLLLTFSFAYAIAYLRTFNPVYDAIAAATANAGILFGLLGFVTGALWGNFAWGALNKWLLQDTKILGALIGILLYMAFFVLRGALSDDEKRARISSVYNIFAWVMFIVFIYVTPRMTQTLHPGNGGNPAFSSYDLDSHLRMVFYPAVIGWMLIGLWISSLQVRYHLLKEKRYDQEN